MTAKEYQSQLVTLLQTKFDHVQDEWPAFPKAKNQYAPRVDIAVGPFNVEGIPHNLTLDYNQLVNERPFNTFLKAAYNCHILNLDLSLYEYVCPSSYFEMLYKNQNARCLIAIEIENKNSRKHIMGSVVNAASLGRVGIGIGYDQAAVNTFLRIINYLSFLKEVEKNTYDTGNFLVLTTNQIEHLLKRRI